jgi:hypothetical protein
VPPQRLLAWRDGFLAAGQAHLAAIDEGTALLVGVEETEKGEQVHYLSPMRPKGPRRPTPP